MPSERRRVVVIGAGAAGTVAAIFAASGGEQPGAGAEITLIESTADGGRKILISGGGRCNILPARTDLARFVTGSSAPMLRRILRSWPLEEQIAFFEREVGIPLAEEKETGKLFPVSNRARDVRDGLIALARRRGVRLRMKTRMTGLERDDGFWHVRCESGGAALTLQADAVILATGGLSVPATGSDGRGLEAARRLGIAIAPTYAALTPLLNEPTSLSGGSGKSSGGGARAFHALSGVSLPVAIRAESVAAGDDPPLRARAEGGFLFTHRGYSGPAVLDVSHVAVRSTAEALPRARLLLSWLGLDENTWREALGPDASRGAGGPRTVLSALRSRLPERLAATLAHLARVDPARSLAELRRDERTRLLQTLVRFELPWTGDEGYKKAEVTGGGVALAEIHPGTLESRRHAGLHLCGEMLDAFGPIGGYNFQWAWATGRAAGLAAAEAGAGARSSETAARPGRVKGALS